MRRSQFEQLLNEERAQSNAFSAAPAASSGREARWAARKAAKANGSQNINTPPQMQAMAPPSYPPALSNDMMAPPSRPPDPYLFDPPPDPVNSNTPNLKRKSVYDPDPPPPAHMTKPPTPPQQSFFTNPVSDADASRRRQQQEYAEYMKQVNTSLPQKPTYKPEPRPPSQSRVSIPMIDPSKDAKKQYQLDLQKQMQEREHKQKHSREKQVKEPEEYFPFGKPGAGAPFRDTSGKIIAVRPPHYNENDPNYLRTSEHYKDLGSSVEVSQQAAYTKSTHPVGYQSPDPSMYQPIVQHSPQVYQQPQPVYQQAYQQPQQAYYPPNQSPYASQYMQPEQQYYEQPPTMAQPSMEYYQPPQQPSQQPRMITPPQIPFLVDEPQHDPAADGRRADLARALSEQIEEKKRRQDEDKRQRILEERMEEARLEKQRREIEEEYLREQNKKKKEFADLQSFNEKNFATSKKTQVRQRTPAEVTPPRTPPRQPPNFQTTEIRVERNGSEIPIEITKKMQSNMDNEIWKLRNEVNHEQNELRDNIVRLKEEAQLANEQRYEAQRDLERMKDDMRQRQLEEDIRARELYNALVLQQRNGAMVADANKVAEWNVPAVNGAKRLVDGMPDPTKSLISDSHFIPLAHAEGPLRPTTPPTDLDLGAMKQQLKLDTAFPNHDPTASLSLGGFEPSHSVASSIGIENINKRNEERLRLLEKVENSANDELSKLDDLLFSYLNENKDEPEISMPRKKAENAMYVINEDEGFLSLPKGGDSLYD